MPANTHPWDVTVGVSARHLATLVQQRLPRAFAFRQGEQAGGQLTLAGWQLLGGEKDQLHLRADTARYARPGPNGRTLDLRGAAFTLLVWLAPLLAGPASAPRPVADWCALDFVHGDELPEPLGTQLAAELEVSFREELAALRATLRGFFVALKEEAFAAQPWLNVTSQRYAYLNRGGPARDYVGILAMTAGRQPPAEALFPSAELDGHDFVYHVSDYVLTRLITRNLNRLLFQLTDDQAYRTGLPPSKQGPLYSFGPLGAGQPQQENQPYEFVESEADGPAYMLPEDRIIIPTARIKALSALRQRFLVRHVLLNHLYFKLDDNQIELHYQTQAAVQTRVLTLANPFTLTTRVRQAYTYVLQTAPEGHQTIGIVELAHARQLQQTRQPAVTDLEHFAADLASVFGKLLDNSWVEVGAAVALSMGQFLLLSLVHNVVTGAAVYAQHDHISVDLLEQRLSTLFTLPEFAGLNLKRVALHQGLLVSGDLGSS